MKLPYFKLPHRDPRKKFVSVPWIPVKINTNDTVDTFLMLADSGTDNCIFDKDIADFMGINLKDGERVETGGLGGDYLMYIILTIST